MEHDISGIDLSAYDVCAVNRAALRYPGNIKFLASYHPEALGMENWPRQRKENGFNDDYSIILHMRNVRVSRMGYPVVTYSGPSTTGSSTLFAVMFGLVVERYDAVLVAGAPLEGEYSTFQDGWIQAKHALAGRVKSMSGWTKTFLEGICP